MAGGRAAGGLRLVSPLLAAVLAAAVFAAAAVRDHPDRAEGSVWTSASRRFVPEAALSCDRIRG